MGLLTPQQFSSNCTTIALRYGSGMIFFSFTGFAALFPAIGIGVGITFLFVAAAYRIAFRKFLFQYISS